MPMLIASLLRIPATALAVLSLSFVLFRLLPGDPTLTILGEYASGAARAELRRELGLERPLAEQYLAFLGGALRGDFGSSLVSRRPALGEALRVLPASLALGGAGLAMALGLGLPLGALAALGRGSWPGWLASGVAVLGSALPAFWLAQLLLLAFALGLGWLPALGGRGPAGLILPALTLGLGGCAPLARLARAALLDVMGQPFITAARGRGLGGAALWLGHGLRAALPPLIAAAGGLLGWMLGNAVLVEVAFARAGLGSLLAAAVSARDYPLIQASLAVLALGNALISAGLDGLYRLADPRVAG